MIILRVVKGDTSCTSVKQSLFMKIVTGDKFVPVHLSCEEAAVYVHRGFRNKGVSRSSLCDELKNFVANNLL